MKYILVILLALPNNLNAGALEACFDTLTSCIGSAAATVCSTLCAACIPTPAAPACVSCLAACVAAHAAATKACYKNNDACMKCLFTTPTTLPAPPKCDKVKVSTQACVECCWASGKVNCVAQTTPDGKAMCERNTREACMKNNNCGQYPWIPRN